MPDPEDAATPGPPDLSEEEEAALEAAWARLREGGLPPPDPAALGG